MVGEQTRQIINAWIERGQQQQLPVKALQTLADELARISQASTEHAA